MSSSLPWSCAVTVITARSGPVVHALLRRHRSETSAATTPRLVVRHACEEVLAPTQELVRAPSNGLTLKHHRDDAPWQTELDEIMIQKIARVASKFRNLTVTGIQFVLQTLDPGSENPSTCPRQTRIGRTTTEGAFLCIVFACSGKRSVRTLH